MIIDTKQLNAPETFQSDVCIMGGGVAGIVLANELLSNSRSVILLESGSEGYEQKTQELYQAESKPDLFPFPETSRLRFLGGTSNIWQNSTERLDPIDFQKRDWVDNSGWPITYEELELFYPKAERYCGVGDDGYDLKFWKDKLNFQDTFSNSDMLATSIIKDAEPTINFFETHGNRLVNSKNIRVFKNANVIGIDFDDELQAIKSVIFRTFNDFRHTINAKIFIMCFGGIENARMLLIFNEKYSNRLGNQFDNVGRYFMEHPTIRAANFYPFQENMLSSIYKVGRKVDKARYIVGGCKLKESALIKHRTNNLRISFNKKSKLALSDGISSAHLLVDSLKKTEVVDNFGSHIVNVLKDADFIFESYLRKEFNQTFFDNVDEFGGYQIISMIEQTPDRNNRIKLGSKIDGLNLKKIEIEWRVTQSDKDQAWKSLELLAQDSAIQSIGRIRLLKERDSRIWGSQLGFGQHHMGTTKMSTNRREGVVDSSLKVFGTTNFYISGSSVFPTGGHVPPTLTIVAMTIKLANELKRII